MPAVSVMFVLGVQETAEVVPPLLARRGTSISQPLEAGAGSSGVWTLVGRGAWGMVVVGSGEGV
jgi:hypothetical protein